MVDFLCVYFYQIHKKRQTKAKATYLYFFTEHTNIFYKIYMGNHDTRTKCWFDVASSRPGVLQAGYFRLSALNCNTRAMDSYFSHAYYPLSSELINSNYQPLEVVPRYRATQLQVTENYLNLLNLTRNVYDYRRLETYLT